MEAGTAKGEAELRPGQGRTFACATRAPATRPNTELTLQISIQEILEVLMVCSALRGLFVYRNELKRPVDRYHPPSLCWGISRVLYALYLPLDLCALTGVRC